MRRTGQPACWRALVELIKAKTIMHAQIRLGSGGPLGLAGLAVFDLALALVLLWPVGHQQGYAGATALIVVLEVGALGFILLFTRHQAGKRRVSFAAAWKSCRLADLAHELRSPLTVLAGEIEAMQIGLREPDAATLEALAGEVQRLARLLHDLDRLLGHSSGPQPPTEAISVGHLIEDLLQRHDRALRKSGLVVQLRLDVVPPLHGDRLRLEQLFTNLLQNSLRYTDVPGRIAITVTQVQPGVLQITWEDSAPGVPGGELPRLTERFYRGRGHRARHPHASGLGLAIARAIAEAHGASMQAQHSALGGLCWTLRINVADREFLQ